MEQQPALSITVPAVETATRVDVAEKAASGISKEKISTLGKPRNGSQKVKSLKMGKLAAQKEQQT